MVIFQNRLGTYWPRSAISSGLYRRQNRSQKARKSSAYCRWHLSSAAKSISQWNRSTARNGFPSWYWRFQGLNFSGTQWNRHSSAQGLNPSGSSSSRCVSAGHQICSDQNEIHKSWDMPSCRWKHAMGRMNLQISTVECRIFVDLWFFCWIWSVILMD